MDTGAAAPDRARKDGLAKGSGKFAVPSRLDQPLDHGVDRGSGAAVDIKNLHGLRNVVVDRVMRYPEDSSDRPRRFPACDPDEAFALPGRKIAGGAARLDSAEPLQFEVQLRADHVGQAQIDDRIDAGQWPGKAQKKDTSSRLVNRDTESADEAGVSGFVEEAALEPVQAGNVMPPVWRGAGEGSSMYGVNGCVAALLVVLYPVIRITCADHLQVCSRACAGMGP